MNKFSLIPLSLITLMISAVAADKGPKLSASHKGLTGSVSSKVTSSSINLSHASHSTPSLSVPTRPMTTGSAFMPGYATPFLRTPTTGSTSNIITYTPEKMFDYRGRYTHTIMRPSRPETRRTRDK